MESGLSLSLYIDGQFSSHRTSDLRKDALQKFMRDTVAMTKYLTPDPYRSLPDPKYYEDRATKDLDLVDPMYPEVSADQRHEIARNVEAAALDRGGDKIISVTAGYYDSLSESAVVSSNGFRGTSKSTAFWSGASATAKDEGDRRPEDWWWQGGRRHREVLSNPTAIGRKAVERALARVGSEKIATETMPMIVENRTMGRLLRFMGGALYGRNLQQSNSYLEGKLGEKIGSDLLTVIDDPFLPRGQNSRHFDGEGISAKTMPIFEKGVLRNYYIDTYYGKKLEMAATTGSPSNITFVPGEKSPEEWMKELDRGILVTGFPGRKLELRHRRLLDRRPGVPLRERRDHPAGFRVEPGWKPPRVLEEAGGLGQRSIPLQQHGDAFVHLRGTWPSRERDLEVIESRSRTKHELVRQTKGPGLSQECRGPLASHRMPLWLAVGRQPWDWRAARALAGAGRGRSA